MAHVHLPAFGPEADSRLKRQVAFWSIIASLVITIGKSVAGLLTGSLALLSDAAHSLLDVAATTMTYLAIRAADKPADDKHHYGHGKIESVAALFETAFLFILSGVVAYEGIRRLQAGEVDISPSWLAVGVLVGSIAVDVWRWQVLRRVAKQTGSEALDADALHFASDLVNSVLVLVAFGAAAMGYPQVDSLVAVGVALFIGIAGFRLARRTLDTLLDTAPRGVADLIRTKVGEVPGVVDLEHVRVRVAGGRIIGEVGIRVSRTLPLEHVSSIKGLVAKTIDDVVPQGTFTITADPIVVDDETVLERVILIGTRLKIPVHHITIQQIDGNLSISADLEIDRKATLTFAHAKATLFEEAVRAEFGPSTEVETHIEPLDSGALTGDEADANTVAQVARQLADEASKCGILHTIHHVRVRSTPSGLVINYHGYANGDQSVDTVHAALDSLERAVRLANPHILRIVGHAEPNVAVHHKTA